MVDRVVVAVPSLDGDSLIARHSSHQASVVAWGRVCKPRHCCDLAAPRLALLEGKDGNFGTEP